VVYVGSNDFNLYACTLTGDMLKRKKPVKRPALGKLVPDYRLVPSKLLRAVTVGKG
jgi:hypothetical protein